MIEVKVVDKDPSQILEIVKEMRQYGLVQGRDFDFVYHPPGYNNDRWPPVTPKHTIFLFYKEKLATMFSLKWL